MYSVKIFINKYLNAIYATSVPWGSPRPVKITQQLKMNPVKVFAKNAEFLINILNWTRSLGAMPDRIFDVIGRSGAAFVGLLALVYPSAVGKSIRENQNRINSETERVFEDLILHVHQHAEPPSDDVEAWNRDLVATVSETSSAFRNTRTMVSRAILNG